MKKKCHKEPLYASYEKPSLEILILDDVLDRVAKRYLDSKENSNIEKPKNKNKKRRI